MDRTNIVKITKDTQQQILLAKLWDKIQSGISRNIPASTCFLSPLEQNLAGFLFGNTEGLHYFGGSDLSERKILVYLPEYSDASYLYSEDSPIACIKASFYKTEQPTHRNFLGALTGEGIARECIGDIQVGDGYCNIYVQREITPYILQNITNVGRIAITTSLLPLSEATVTEEVTEQLNCTVSSLRLDCVAAAAFRLSRSTISDYISAGKVFIDGVPCEKQEHLLECGSSIAVRGLGKRRFTHIGGISKKGRICITVEIYK